MEKRGQVAGRRVDDIWARWDKRVRDTIIFLVGVGGCINELFFIADPRPAALVFLASLIGIPFVLSADESKASPPPEAEDGDLASSQKGDD